MQELITTSERRSANLKHAYKRFLFSEIDWSQRLIVLLGHRGAGKTTMLLQAMQQMEKSIYISLDNIYFEANRLAQAVDALHESGFRHFFLDEVHRYPHWSADLKHIYDSYDDLKLVVTGSSILEISKGRADLSRRATVYRLPGLSFREFLELQTGMKWETVALSDLLEHHGQMDADLTDRSDVPSHFQDYLRFGYYPFYLEGSETYLGKLMESSNLIIDLDIQAYEQLQYSTVRNLKKLLYIISRSVPFKPNVTKLSEQLSVSRNTLLKMLDLMDRAQLLSLLKSDAHGNSFLQKPEKIYLNNPNLPWAFADGDPGIGNLRETFFLNQLSYRHEVAASKWADFLVDGQFTFEIGGPSKTARQLKGVPEAFLALDGLKHGSGKRIPLWLFGFLY